LEGKFIQEAPWIESGELNNCSEKEFKAVHWIIIIDPYLWIIINTDYD
jgi:hypothetical protein